MQRTSFSCTILLLGLGFGAAAGGAASPVAPPGAAAPLPVPGAVLGAASSAFLDGGAGAVAAAESPFAPAAAVEAVLGAALSCIRSAFASGLACPSASAGSAGLERCNASSALSIFCWKSSCFSGERNWGGGFMASAASFGVLPTSNAPAGAL